jgi:hemolysin III
METAEGSPGVGPMPEPATGSRAAAIGARPTWRGRSHQLAAIVFPLLCVPLLVAADTAHDRVAVAVYAVGVTAMYAVSAAYHRGRWSEEARRRMRRLDHSTILIAIASTYTPLVAVGLHGSIVKVVLVVEWVGALVGVAVRMLWLDAPRPVTVAAYLVVGWVALGILPRLLRDLGGAVFGLMIAGGLVYSLAAAVYSRRRPDPWPATFGYHEVFHALVIAAGACFYAGIALVV